MTDPPTLTELTDRFYCLGNGHKHENRYHEALCSAAFQVDRNAKDGWNMGQTAHLLRHALDKMIELHAQGCNCVGARGQVYGCCETVDYARKVMRGEVPWEGIPLCNPAS